MSSPALDAFNEEMVAYRAKLVPVQEGLKDLDTPDLQGDAKVAVQTAMASYEALVSAVNAAISAVSALASGSYPEVPEFNVPPEVHALLTENARNVRAALGIFNKAPEPKPETETEESTAPVSRGRRP